MRSDSDDLDDLDSEDGEADDGEPEDERTDDEVIEEAERVIDESGIYDDRLVVSPVELADLLGLPAAAVRDVAASLDVPRLGATYAISRDDATDVVNELATAGVI